MQSLEERIAAAVREEIAIVPYDPGWRAAFERERDHLRACLPRRIVRRIEHFGSTAVPGLAAKPVIDMLVEVSDLATTRAEVAPLLRAQGYETFWRPTHGDYGPPFYCWFITRDRVSRARTHHIHMVERSFLGHWQQLLFRDRLIVRPDLAAEYAALKQQLANTAGDRVEYTHGKSEFIGEVMRALERS